MVARVVVLGGGVAGTLVANRLSRRRDVAVTLVDNHGRHLYQPGQLYLAFNDRTIAHYERDEASLLRRNVALRVARARSVDPDRRRVDFEDGSSLDYDWLVVATGSRVFHENVPGLKEHGLHFHCPNAAMKLKERLRAFTGGRIVVGAASLPYKCPPSAVEFALLLDEWCRARSIRAQTDIVFTYPIDGVFPRPEVGDTIRRWFADRSIRVETSFVPAGVEPSRLTAADGRTLDFTLLVMVPPHKAAPFLRDSALAGPSGFVPVDRHTLRARDRVYAAGDSADLPVPKSGAAAHFQAPVVAANIAAELDGAAPESRYDGRVGCFLEAGGGKAAWVSFDYDHPPAPPKLTRLTRLRKALFNTFYFQIIGRG